MNSDEANVIIITGAGGGLGGTMARGLLKAGRRVAGVDIDAGAKGLAALTADAAAAGYADRLFTTIADVRSPESADALVARTLERFGTLQGLINNAGLGPFQRPSDAPANRPGFLAVPPAYWQALIETNVNGPFMMTRAVAPHLIAAGWGRIVNVTTSLSTMVMQGMSPYGAAKAALEAATAIFAKDLAGTGVTANVLVPGGAADTPMVPAESMPDRSQLIAPQVMVAPAVWLTSRASDGTTAQRIIAKTWKPDGPIAENLRATMTPAAWDLP
jgi:NAD(P)-dependent dehydrogenase (short-subunit alcohol dehydrogenase family)